jgi:phage baseplate assembly protein gpV
MSGTITAVSLLQSPNKMVNVWYVDVRIHNSTVVYKNIRYCTDIVSHINPNVGMSVNVFQPGLGGELAMYCVPIKETVKDYANRQGVLSGNFANDILIEYTDDAIKIGYIGTKPLKVEIHATNVEVSATNVQVNSEEVTITSDIINLDAPEVVCSGELTAQFITGITDTLSGGKSGASHTHTSTAPGTPTSPPL